MEVNIVFILLIGYIANPSSGYQMCPPPPYPPPPGCCPPPGAPPPPYPPASDCPSQKTTTLPPPPPPSTTVPPATTTAAPATTTTTASNPATTSSTGGTSPFAIKVKALIDAGTCSSVATSTTLCGSASDSYSYYETFTYKTYRVVIISGVPNHQSEYSQTMPNPNKRCVRYQYVALPLTPTKSTPKTTPMGATAYFKSGTVMYNPLSSPQGNLALDKEWISLDPCYGHSSPDSQYHYHAVSGTCLPGASSPSTRALLGYALDGFPVYGYAQNSAGQTLKSCWKTTLSSPTMITDFTYDSTGYAAGTCHLDQANGYTFSDGYGYVTTAEPYYVPYYYSGSTWTKICGFTP